MKISIMQPHFLPWIGYFYMIYKSKNFVFLDDVKFHYQSWQHRNYIYANNKPILLTASIDNITKNNKILEVKFKNNFFKKKHLKSIHQAYSKTKFFNNFYPILEGIYNTETKNINEFNQIFIKKITEINNIESNFYKASELQINLTKQDKLIEICKKLNAKTFLSTPGSSAYLTNKNFMDANISLEYLNYDKIEKKKN